MSFYIVPTAEASVLTLIKSIDKVIINPIIIFLFACAMVYFLYGLAQYLLSPDNEEVRKTSKSHMIWGIFGLFIMVAVFGIMRLLLNTFGETKIQVNNNGDFNVSSTKLDDRGLPVDSVKTGQDLFEPGSEDLSISSDTPNLPANQYATNPFPTYEARALCWNNDNKPILGKSSTEYNALDLAKTDARNRYLSSNGILASDKTKEKYPQIFESKVLYDKNTKIYYAWLDVRAPKGNGTMSDCNLKVLAPARSVPDSIIFSQSNVSTQTDTVDLPAEVYISSPFATYEAKPSVCWNKQLLGKSNTEYGALDAVKNLSRSSYLSANGISSTDTSKAKYPLVFESKVLYSKSAKTYYAWWDVRAPINNGKLSDCSLKVLTQARTIPDSIVFSQVAPTDGEVNLSASDLNNNITDFTKNPFRQKYIPNNLCWHEELYANADTEFKALSLAKFKARSFYISDNNLSETTTPENLPTTYASFTAYDKVTKNYYVWLDVRAPVGAGKTSDCNLLLDGEPLALEEITARSAKPDPLAKYASDNQYYRVVDSGSDANYFVARSIAINNALIQIARLKGLDSATEVTSKTILEEKYYPQDIYTGNYDYWVAIQSPK